MFALTNILVTGGTGFVSGALAEHLTKKGFTVDILTLGDKPLLFSGFRNHFIGDRHSSKFLQQCLHNKNYDFVFDITAYTPDDIKKIISAINLSKLEKFVFCSSAAVYMPSNKIKKEDAPKGFNASWQDYGYNKLLAERLLFDLHKKNNLSTVIFRPTYIYGEGNNLYREAYFFDRMTNNLIIPIPDSKTRVQFIYIKDLVKTFESVIYSEIKGYEAFNLAFHEKVSWLKLIKATSTACRKKPLIKKISLHKTKKLKIPVRSFFPFRDETFLFSTQKLKNSDLFLPKTKLVTGMKKAFAWYSKTKPVMHDLKMNKIDDVLVL